MSAKETGNYDVAIMLTLCVCTCLAQSRYLQWHVEMRGYMFNKEEYDTIASICNKNDELSRVLSDLRETSLDELSVVSHEIKNYAAYLKTSYQFISRKNSELNDNKFWNNMGTTIDELVEYMNRTSLYRYSFKDSETVKCSVSDILERISKHIDKKYSAIDCCKKDYCNKDYDEKKYDEKNYTSDRNSSNILLKTELINTDENAVFYISSHLLTLGINELIDNACEAAIDNICETAANNVYETAINNVCGTSDHIQLLIRVSNHNNTIIISIMNQSDNEPDYSLLVSGKDCSKDDNLSIESNSGYDKIGNDNSNTYNYDLRKLCTPFFTPKENHTGLGLSSVYQMCILSGTSFNMTYNSYSHMTTTSITLKKA